MAKKHIQCEKCTFQDGILCKHESNKGVIIKYRLETPVYFKTCIEINKNGDCKNFVELSKK